MTEDHPQRAIHVAKADKICAGHDSLAMHKKVAHASCVDSLLRRFLCGFSIVQELRAPCTGSHGI